MANQLIPQPWLGSMLWCMMSTSLPLWKQPNEASAFEWRSDSCIAMPQANLSYNFRTPNSKFKKLYMSFASLHHILTLEKPLPTPSQNNIWYLIFCSSYSNYSLFQESSSIHLIWFSYFISNINNMTFHRQGQG